MDWTWFPGWPFDLVYWTKFFSQLRRPSLDWEWRSRFSGHIDNRRWRASYSGAVWLGLEWVRWHHQLCHHQERRPFVSEPVGWPDAWHSYCGWYFEHCRQQLLSDRQRQCYGSVCRRDK